jgi:anti-anti-sigma factor
LEKQKIEINLPANLKFSYLMRDIANEVFCFAGFNKEWCNRLKLVVDELFMNAVKYGSTEDKSVVRVIILYDEKEVEFKIEDDGTGTRKTSVEDLKALIDKNASNNDLTRTSGRGLALITSLWTDKLEIQPSSFGGIAVSFKKTIEKTPPPPPKLIQAAIDMPAPDTFKVTEKEEPKGPAFTVQISGDLGQLGIEKLVLPVQEQIKALPEGATLVLDFKEVDYINSTFIGYLASWYNSVKEKRGRIVLLNTSDQIRDVLDIVGIKHVLAIQS